MIFGTIASNRIIDNKSSAQPGVFFAEFTMDDTVKAFKISSIYTNPISSVEYSSDNVNWTTMTGDVNVNGSLKWYVRNKPGQPQIESISFDNSWFITCDQMNSSEITDFNGMFINCRQLTSIPNIDTSKGTNFSVMFRECQFLTSIPALDTSKGTNFNGMFYNCLKLVCLTSIDTTSGTTFVDMFKFTASLVAPDTATQSQIMSGLNWTNPDQCPKPFYYEDFDNTLGSEWTLSGWTKHSGYIRCSSDGDATLTLPTMPSSGTLYVTYDTNIDWVGYGVREVQNNGSLIGNLDSEELITESFSLPAGSNTILFYQKQPGPPPPLTPPITEIFTVSVFLD